MEDSESVPQKSAVGLIGLGLLGSALAERLLVAGYAVRGFDLMPAARERLQQLGGTACSRLQDVARDESPVVLCLPNSDIVGQVLQELATQLSEGMLVIDTTTGDPGSTQQAAEHLAAQGIELVDATVLGSSLVVRQGQAALMVGASPHGWQQSRQLLESLSAQVRHVGPPGCGQQMKLVANLVLGLNRAVLAEGLSLARAMGLDLTEVLDVLQSGAASSAVMAAKGQKMITAEFEPQAKLSQHLKDVRLILQQGADFQQRLPLSELHCQLLQYVADAGGGESDNSAVIQAWQDPNLDL